MNQYLPSPSLLGWLLVFYVSLFLIPPLHAQQPEWELDRIHKRETARQKIQDSLMLRLKNRWEIKLGLGRWNLDKHAKSDQEELFFLPSQMGYWQLGLAWHFQERVSAEISLGLQLKREVPDRPNIFSVLYGSNVDIEGSGALIVPLSLGIRYYLREKRFRPLIGLSTGMVLSQSKYTIAEGNLSNGIRRIDVTRKSRTWTGSVLAGFDYRLNKHAQFSTTLSYHSSGEFRETIGGFLRYQGFGFGIGISLIPFSETKIAQ